MYDHSCMIICMVNKIVCKNVAQVLHAFTVTTRSILLRIWFFVPHQETTDWKFERRVTNITWKGKSSFLQGKKSMMYDDHRLSLNSRCVRQKQFCVLSSIVCAGVSEEHDIEKWRTMIGGRFYLLPLAETRLLAVWSHDMV